MKSRKPTSAPKAATSGAPQGRSSGGGRGNAARADRLKERGASTGKSPMPTAGPSDDDRGFDLPEKVLEGELKARIIGLSVIDTAGALEVRIAAGLNQGLYEGMFLELSTAKGRPLADIVVWDVSDRLCRATVKPEIGRVTPDMISAEGGNVILKPR